MGIEREVSPHNPSFLYSVISFLLLRRHRSVTLEPSSGTIVRLLGALGAGPCGCKLECGIIVNLET
jgi:hypothetical protein